MKETKVLQDKDGNCSLLLKGTTEDGEMALIVREDNNVIMSYPSVLYLIEQLLEHNDMTLEDYKVGIESIRRQLPKN